TQPIALHDVVHLLEAAVRRDDVAGQTCDIGGPDVLTYRQMIRDVADLSERRRFLLPAPLFTPRLSRLWVSLVTGTSPALVGPLVESLRHPMVARDRRLQEREARPGIPWREALEMALREPHSGSPRRSRHGRTSPVRSTVRSVQRLTRPPGASAHAVAHAYLAWLPHFLWWALRVRVDADGVAIYLRALGRPLLRLRLDPGRSTPDRTLLRVTGGLLARNDRRGRLEFRVAPRGDSIIAAVHDFSPRLPWFIYVMTQAKAHLVVMWAFDRYLRRTTHLTAPDYPPVGEHRA
ncbi:MAG: hypothetical protein AAF721_40550, partial [Myxococcota bacterium]